MRQTTKLRARILSTATFCCGFLYLRLSKIKVERRMLATLSHLVDDVQSGRVLYSDALKDSRRSIEEIVPFKLL